MGDPRVEAAAKALYERGRSMSYDTRTWDEYPHQPAFLDDARVALAAADSADPHREELEALLRRIANELAEDSGSLTSTTAVKLQAYYSPTEAGEK